MHNNALNGSEINLLNWNIKKLNRARWQQDLQHFGSGVDLVLIQEAAVNDKLFEALAHAPARSFTAGYCRPGKATGVMTFSRVEPLQVHRHRAPEPVPGIHKASTLTTYALSDSDESLMVANLHAVNFCWNNRYYGRQMQQLIQLIEIHRGPLIFAGDFNTWLPERQRIVREMAGHLELDEVDFDSDSRKKVFGRPIDYIFTRGLRTLSAETHTVTSSDHNPMLASFSL